MNESDLLAKQSSYWGGLFQQRSSMYLSIQNLIIKKRAAAMKIIGIPVPQKRQSAMVTNMVAYLASIQNSDGSQSLIQSCWVSYFVLLESHVQPLSVHLLNPFMILHIRGSTMLMTKLITIRAKMVGPISTNHLELKFTKRLFCPVS